MSVKTVIYANYSWKESLNKKTCILGQIATIEKVKTVTQKCLITALSGSLNQSDASVSALTKSWLQHQ